MTNTERASAWIGRRIGERFEPVLGLDRRMLEHGTDGERLFERYIARDLKSNAYVALECFRGEYEGKPGCSNPELRNVQERARQFLPALNHPNIAKLHGFGNDGDDFFIVREWVHGCSLDRWLDFHDGRIGVDIATLIAIDLSRALDAIATKRGDEVDKISVGVDNNTSSWNVILSADGAIRLATARTQPLLKTSIESIATLPKWFHDLVFGASERREEVLAALQSRHHVRVDSPAAVELRDLAEQMLAWISGNEVRIQKIDTFVPPALAEVLRVHLEEKPFERGSDFAAALLATLPDGEADVRQRFATQVTHDLASAQFAPKTGLPRAEEMAPFVAQLRS